MFKKIRTLWSKPSFVLSLALVFFLFSCQESFNASTKNDYSGEELFKGIFFSQGEVAEKLPSLGKRISYRDIIDSNDVAHTKIVAVQNLFVEKMQEEDPSFFADFKAKINSGDHLRIKKALADAGSRLNASIESVSGMNSEQLSLLAKGLISKYNLKDENGQLSEEALKETILGLTTDGSDANMEECIEIVLVVVLLLAVTVVDVVGAVVVVTAVEVVTEYDTAVARTRGDALFLDQLVDEIAVNLN